MTPDLFLQGEELAPGIPEAWRSAFAGKDALERIRIAVGDNRDTAKSRGALAVLLKVLTSVPEMTTLLFLKDCTCIYFYFLPVHILARNWVLQCG